MILKVKAFSNTRNYFLLPQLRNKLKKIILNLSVIIATVHQKMQDGIQVIWCSIRRRAERHTQANKKLASPRMQALSHTKRRCILHTKSSTSQVECVLLLIHNNIAVKFKWIPSFAGHKGRTSSWGKKRERLAVLEIIPIQTTYLIEQRVHLRSNHSWWNRYKPYPRKQPPGIKTTLAPYILVQLTSQ